VYDGPNTNGKHEEEGTQVPSNSLLFKGRAMVGV